MAVPTDSTKRAIDFTRDIGLVGVPFDAVLRSNDIGPFIRWDRIGSRERLDVVGPGGVTLNFAGDPNVLHSFTGSPTGFNRVCKRSIVPCCRPIHTNDESCRSCLACNHPEAEI